MTRVPQTPGPYVRAALRTFLATQPLPDGVTAFQVASSVPKDWSVDSGVVLIVVADDGGPVDWPVKSSHTVRLVVRAKGEPLADPIASVCAGHILDTLPEGLAYMSKRATFTKARDTKTGADMASFTVTATVRTRETV